MNKKNNRNSKDKHMKFRKCHSLHAIDLRFRYYHYSEHGGYNYYK
jgi:hypothetical protein